MSGKLTEPQKNALHRLVKIAPGNALHHPLRYGRSGAQKMPAARTIPHPSEPDE